MMNGEIEFLPVGEASRAGDAIVVRYGSDQSYGLMLIDGGHQESGSDIVEHLKTQFPGRGFDHVVLTHPDIDHASGLRTVLAEVTVSNLWMILPWEHAADAAHLFDDKTIGPDDLADQIREAYPVLDELLEIARMHSIPVRSPFQGEQIGPFKVLSPSYGDYLHLLPQFDRTPAADAAALQRASKWIGKETLWARIAASLQEKATSWIRERWDIELLRDGGKTSATNESSVVLYGEFETGPALLTGDAGISALSAAADYAEATLLPLQQFRFVQIPHHGSRSNVGPSILDRIVGGRKASLQQSTFSAFASAPKDDDSHPRKMVLNAFTRRGGAVLATQGAKIVYFGGFRLRPGYDYRDPIAFADYVEAYD
jgi:beta-lactamase superfamily II metal-dependent hydrolase